MELNKYNGAEILANLEVDRILLGSVGRTEDEDILGILKQAIEASRAGVLPLPRFEDDQFISSSELKKLADRATMNNKVLLAECEALMATAQVVGSILESVEGATSKSCTYASEAVRTLLAYHEAMSTSGRSIIVVPEHLNGSFEITGGSITSPHTGGSNAGLMLESIETNGVVGNFVEVASSTPVGRILTLEEISLIDKLDTRKRHESISDGDESSMLEIESYDVIFPNVIATEVSESIMPRTLTKVKRSVREEGKQVRLVDVDWSTAPRDGSLYADLTFSASNGAISTIVIRLASRVDINETSIPIPSVERVDVSKDGKSWIKVDCATDAIITSAGGRIIVSVNAPSSSYVRIRLRQSASYKTLILNAAHWMISADGSSGSWIIGDGEPSFTIEVSNKELWFRPSLFIDANGNRIKRDLFAIQANRYSLSIREIKAETHQFAPETVLESKSYQFPSKIDRVILRSDETIPEGTAITYEISPDDGGNYYPIVPMERSGQGAEVLVFSSGGVSNPNIKSASYVMLNDRPTRLRVRVTLSALDSVAPSIKRMSLEPIFVEE